MPTTLPQQKPDRRRAGWGVMLKFAMVVSVLLLGALVQITAQIHFSAPHDALAMMAATLEAPR